MSDPNNSTSPEAIPEQARVSLVPIANPATADDLLRLALSLAHTDGGKVIALIVSLGTDERQAQSFEELETIVQGIKDEGHNIELEMTVAPSIARGILDSAREEGADLIILGIRQQKRGEVILGTIAENVLTTSPCDVLIYRTSDNAGFKHIVVPVESGSHAEVAAKIGLRLSKRQNIKIEVMYAQGGHISQYEGLARIEHVIADLPGKQVIKRTVLTANNAAKGILSRTGKDDLIIVGFTERSELEHWFFGNFSGELLNHAQGPVIMVSRAIGGDAFTARVRRRIIGWIRPILTHVEQDEIIRQAHGQAAMNIDYTALIVVSAALATLGLLLNSAAIIIGAMLVAPLMSPLIALSAGLTVGRIHMARQALSTLVIGVVLALFVATIVGIILPLGSPTPEMLSRGSPTLLDAAVALASGFIGAYATARKDIPSALAGVAIAAALMPPLCTIGLGFAFRDLDLAYGASVLFLTNIISIIMAGIAVFLWMGMSFRRYKELAIWLQIFVISMLMLAALPVVIELNVLTTQANQESKIIQEIENALLPAEVIEIDIIHETPMRAVVTVRSSVQITDADVADIQVKLDGELDRPVKLDLIVLQVISISVEPGTTAEETAEPGS